MRDDGTGGLVLAVLILAAGIIGTAWAYDWDFSCVFVQCVKVKGDR